jgi:hypothetical protein
MGKVTIDIEDETLRQIQAASRLRQETVEQFLLRQAREAAQAPVKHIVNPSHRKIMEAAARPLAEGETERDAWHDRDRARAEAYAEARKRLLDLIDRSAGDMGSQTWDRASLYDP